MTMNSLKIFTLIFFQFFFIYSFSQSNSIQNSEFTVVIDAGHGGKDPEIQEMDLLKRILL